MAETNRAGSIDRGPSPSIQRGIVPPEDVRLAVVAYVARMGLDRAAAAIGIYSTTALRIIGGQRVQRATVAAARAVRVAAQTEPAQAA